MKNITVSAFRGELKRYLDIIEAGGVVEVRNIKIGRIDGDLSVQRGIEGGVIEDKVHVEAEEESVQKCELCGKGCEGVWVFWEEGEEREVSVGCVMRRRGSEKMYKMITKGYRWKE